jgi:hypothetical protein
LFENPPDENKWKFIRSLIFRKNLIFYYLGLIREFGIEKFRDYIQKKHSFNFYDEYNSNELSNPFKNLLYFDASCFYLLSYPGAFNWLLFLGFC